MKPYRSGPDVHAAWGPVRAPDAHDTGRAPDLRQHLELRDAAGAFRNRVGPASGVDATGWNWSAQFGDLDNDSSLDLFTVNGMVGEAFGYYPARSCC